MKLSGKILLCASLALMANPVIVVSGTPQKLAENTVVDEAAVKLTQPSSPALAQYIEKAKKAIDRNWFPAADPKGHAVVFFRVAKDGRVFWVELDDCSGTPSVNQSAEDAIAALGKLPPLPAGMETLDLAVEFNSKVCDSAKVYYSRPAPDRVKSAQVLLVEAEADTKAKAYSHACELLEQAYEMTPFNIRLRDQLIEAYIAAAGDSKPEQAASLLHKAFLIDPQNEKSRAKLNSYWKNLGKDFNNVESVTAVAAEYSKNNQPIDAVAEYCQAWLLKPSPELISDINKACLMREAYKSVQKWQTIVERDKSADNLVALAKAFESCGDTTSARVTYKKALKADRENEAARKFLEVANHPTGPEAQKVDSEKDDDDDDEQEAGENKTLSLIAPAAVSLTDSFPLGSTGQKTLHVSIISNRQNVQDYFPEACMGKEVHRWTPGRFPLRLYVANGSNVPGYRPIMNQMAINAFAAWSKGSEHRLSYVVVNDPRGANVTLDWTADPAKMTIANAQGQTYFQFMRSGTGNNTIKGAKISILTVWRHDKSVLTDKAMNMVCIHEIGHALGLSGHSPRRSDIMFYAISPKGPFLPGLSAGDKATVKHLYQGYEHPAPTTVEHPQPSMK